MKVRGVRGSLLFGKGGREKDRNVPQIPKRGRKSSPWQAKEGEEQGRPTRRRGKTERKERRIKSLKGKQRAKVKAEHFDRRDDGHLHSDSETDTLSKQSTLYLNLSNFKLFIKTQPLN